MLIDCKTAGCNGHVDYTPQDIPLTLFSAVLENNGVNLFSYIPNDKFRTAVTSIVKDSKNAYNRIKTVYLTCDNTASPHTNAYEVPAT